MHHRLDVRPGAIDLGVDEALPRRRVITGEVVPVEVDGRHVVGANLVLGTDAERMAWLDQDTVRTRQTHTGVAHVVDKLEAKEDAAHVSELPAELGFFA
jgi:hypothetical protein